MSATLRATVESFDEYRGDGVLLDDSGERFYFHCVTLGDGTRTIPVGTRVLARRRVGLMGCDEAEAVERVR